MKRVGLVNPTARITERQSAQTSSVTSSSAQRATGANRGSNPERVGWEIRPPPECSKLPADPSPLTRAEKANQIGAVVGLPDSRLKISAKDRPFNVG